jgi:putative transcriptional regulator
MIYWNVRAIAEKHGIKTGTELAERIGVNINTGHKLWSGRSERVDRETLAKLCKELQCTPGDLLVYDEETAEDPLLAAA